MSHHFSPGRRRFALASVGSALAGSGLLPSIARAQASGFPSRPLRIVVAFAPGGGSDIAARLLAKPLSEALGQPVIVDNKPGGDGVIAGSEVARAAPDGHTLFLATASPITYIPAVQLTKPPYDPLKDFAPVTHFVSYTYVLVVHESVPARTYQEFVAYAKSRPGQLAYGAANATTHLALVQAVQSSGLDLTHVPYKGESLALPDLRAGRIHAMFLAPNVIDQLEGKVRAIAVLGDKRSPLVPDVPTFAEVGVPSVNILPWTGIFTTGGTPAPVVERLSTEFNAVFRIADVQSRLNQSGSKLEGSTPAFLGDLVRSQLTAWKLAVKAANLPTT